MRIPLRATCRLQLTPASGFDAARAAVPYLHTLGISHLYLSPIFCSRAGSTHGYDVTDHSCVNAELGGEKGFQHLVAACHAHGMGVVLDIVPNHMAVMTDANHWWMDLLKNGPASEFADYFDIDWAPARASMRNRLLVPVLDEPLGTVIDQHGIALAFDRGRGAFAVRYGALEFPVAPQTYGQLLAALALRSGAPELLALRDGDQNPLHQSLASLCAHSPATADAIEAGIDALNELGSESDAEVLAQLLARQPYRLAFWRVSGEEINYRRFFDVNELAALRMEDRRVFDATHALIHRLWRAGAIDGVRVDHADGLYDPTEYFHRLRTLLVAEDTSQRPWIVVEKILGTGEKLPVDWEVDGTTGYEFAALVTGWLMHDGGAAVLEDIYRRFAGAGPAYAEIAYQSRKQVMRTSLAAEISGLAARLDRLAQGHRDTSDFTLFDLREAIVEVIASFPVYRTYVRGDGVSPEDSQHIRRAVGAASGRKQTARRALEFLERVLLGDMADAPGKARALEFTMKFQQVSAPVMAKGIEDTACYRYPCLLAMNEVGGDPTCRGISTETLHRANVARARDYPHSMLASSTHDTKRGEDARYRLCVLTEMPAEWQACLRRWRRLKSRKRDALSPGRRQEYLLLQSALAIWPAQFSPAQVPELRARLAEYAVKSAREAKEQTSWLDADAQYEELLRDFVHLLVPDDGNSGFVRYFRTVIERAAYCGMLNALSATVLKLTAPGVPDIYQGNELPALVLVDPDNRRDPGFSAHAAALEEIAQMIRDASLAVAAAAMRESWRDGRLKLFVTWRLLDLRREIPQVFDGGSYLPLATAGEHAACICAYARTGEDCSVIVVVSRWAATRDAGAEQVRPASATWGNSAVQLTAEIAGGRYLDVFTGREVTIAASDEAMRELRPAQLFDLLPVSVLVSRPSQAPAVQTAATSAR